MTEDFEVDWKSLAVKIDAAVAIGLVTGILYLWGWYYWAHYYAFFGLPSSLGTLGFERLTLAGSWYLWRFASRGAAVLLAAVVAFRAVRRLVVRCFPNWSKRVGERAAIWTIRLNSRWVVGPVAVLLVCVAYDRSLDFIRRDSQYDAEARTNEPSNQVVIRIKGKAAETSEGSYDLLEQRDGTYYLIHHRDDAPTEVMVIRESELESMTVRRRP